MFLVIREKWLYLRDVLFNKSSETGDKANNQ